MNHQTRRFWLITILAVVACAWIGWLLSIPAAEWIEAKWGPKITEAVKYRSYDVSWFIRCRVFDVTWLITVLGTIAATLACLKNPAKSGLGKLVVASVVCFVAANVFALATMQTGTFWLTLQTLGPDYRLPSVSAEWQMLRESKTATKGILLGSSQAPAQVNVKVLNEQLGPDVQFANLSYIGSQCSDLLMLQNHLQPEVDVAVCYLSEMSFYRGVRGNHVLTLMTPISASDLKELGGDDFLPELDKRYGRLSCAMPLFRARRGIEAAFFGVTGTPEISFSRTEVRSNQQRSDWFDQFVDSFRNDETSAFQKQALEKLIQNFASSNTDVMLIAGSINPLVGDGIGPEYREDMLLFLHDLESRYHNVTVVEEDNELPRAGLAPYRDWTHLREQYRPHYSRVVAELLSRQFGWAFDRCRDAT